MNLLKCSKGHYYDGDKFANCPYCSGASASSAGDSVTIAMPSGSSEDVTVALSPSVPDDPITISDSSASSQFPSSDVGSVHSYAEPSLPDDDSMTVSYYQHMAEQTVSIEPVVGWLVCISGKYLGQSFSLKAGRNFIGRSSAMDICLEGEQSVSRNRHAIIIYEPRGRIFFAQPGDSRELFYLNDQVVLDNERLQPYDIISIGNINMMLIPFCTQRFAWEDLNEKEKKCVELKKKEKSK